MQLIIGVTGARGAGKTEVVEQLTWCLATVVRVATISDYVRAEAEALKRNEGRIFSLSELSMARRREHGVGYWIEMILNDPIKTDRKILIIDGLRNPSGDIIALREYGVANDINVVVLGVEASFQTRFERTKLRAREESMTDKQIRRDMRLDLRSGGKYGFNLPVCLKLSDVKIPNEGSIRDLETQAIRTIHEILSSFKISIPLPGEEEVAYDSRGPRRLIAPGWVPYVAMPRDKYGPCPPAR